MSGLCRRVVARLDLKRGLGVIKGCRLEGLRRLGAPREMAREYEDQGADEILALDLTASLYGQGPDLELVRALNRDLTIPLTYGGGVRSVEDVRAVMRAGAEMIAINTAAIADPGLITRCAKAFGSQAVVISALVAVWGLYRDQR